MYATLPQERRHALHAGDRTAQPDSSSPLVYLRDNRGTHLSRGMHQSIIMSQPQAMGPSRSAAAAPKNMEAAEARVIFGSAILLIACNAFEFISFPVPGEIRPDSVNRFQRLSSNFSISYKSNRHSPCRSISPSRNKRQLTHDQRDDAQTDSNHPS